MKSHTLTASLEDYLETVFALVQEKGAARPKDIALKLNVRAASVTAALKILAEKGLINYAPYDLVTLTADGKKVARVITKKHDALLDFFVNVLGIAKENAEEFACKMEHSIPDRVLDRIIAFSDQSGTCPVCGAPRHDTDKI